DAVGSGAHVDAVVAAGDRVAGDGDVAGGAAHPDPGAHHLDLVRAGCLADHRVGHAAHLDADAHVAAVEAVVDDAVALTTLEDDAGRDGRDGVRADGDPRRVRPGLHAEAGGVAALAHLAGDGVAADGDVAAGDRIVAHDVGPAERDDPVLEPGLDRAGHRDPRMARRRGDGVPAHA